MQDDWWGWFRIAWMPDDPRRNPLVPAVTFDRRHPEIWDDPQFLDHRWDDAT